MRVEFELGFESRRDCWSATATAARDGVETFRLRLQGGFELGGGGGVEHLVVCWRSLGGGKAGVSFLRRLFSVIVCRGGADDDDLLELSLVDDLGMAGLGLGHFLESRGAGEGMHLGLVLR